MRCDTELSKDIINIFNSKTLEEVEGLVFILTSTALGNIEEELGEILIEKYLYKLSEFVIIPKSIILMNKSVVLLTKKKIKISNYLKKLQDRGTEILICKTSADYFKVSDKILFGNLVDMEVILEKEIAATKLIKI